MLEYYIFTTFLLYQGFAVSLSSTDCNGQECDDFPDCSNYSCPCLHPSKMYCNIYYICIDNFVQKFSCSSGLLFDEDNLTCDYENKVDCKNRTLVPPSVSSTQEVSTVKDLDLHTTIKYSHLSEVETTPITISDIGSSLQTDKQEITDINSTMTITENDETKTSSSKSITNVTEISFSTVDLKTASSTIQANATDQRPISEEVTSEATSHSQNEDISEATSKHQDEVTSEATNQSQDEDLSKATSKHQDEDISEATSKHQEEDIVEATSKHQDEKTSETTSQSQVENISEATSKLQDDKTSEATSQSQDENMTEATSPSQDEKTSEKTLVPISIDDSSTEHSKSTVKFITKEPITKKPTTLNNITQSTTITLDTSSDSFTKRNSTSSISEYISTKGQPSEETKDGNDLNYNFSCPSRFGLFPDLENCNFFYQCSHFLPYHMQCPSDLHFNPVLQVCDWPYEAGCENATSKDLETSTSIISTKIASSTAQPTKISYPSSPIAYTTAKYATSHKTVSTSDHVSSTVKNIFSTEKESTSTKSVKEITENSTDIKTLMSNLPTTSMIDITTTSKPDNLTNTEISLETISPNENITVEPQTDKDETSMIDITTVSKPDNLTSMEVSLGTISPNENITVQPQTDNDEISINMTNSTERTNQFESTVTESITKVDKTSSKLMTTEIDLSNTTDTTLKPQTKANSSEITISFETTITDQTTTEETIVINFSTVKTIGENDMNDTTLNPETKTASVEIKSESEPIEVSSSSEVETSSDPIETDATSEVETSSENEPTETSTVSEVETSSESEPKETDTASEAETMETKIATTFVNVTENNKIITDAPEMKTSSRKADFEYTVTVTHLQSSTLNNNFTASDFEIVSTTYNITTPDHDQKTISTGKENITSTPTATQEFVTFTTKALGSTSSVPVVNISTQSTNEILESTTNIFLTDKSMQTSQPDKMDLTTETLPEETSDEIVQNFTCISRFGLFPDPESCNYFYQCSHFIPYHLQCPSDLHFNPILEVCDWPYEAGCELNSTDSSKETDKVYTPHPQTNTASNISSTYKYQTDETREDIISTETESTETESNETESTETESTETASTEKATPSESDKLLTSLKSTYKPSSTATPDVTTFDEMTSKISNYSTLIFINSTPEVDNEITSSDEQAFTTKNSSVYSTIDFINSTKETEFEITSFTEQEIVTKNDSDYSTIKFKKETEIETTSIDNKVITTKNNSDYSTIHFTNSTKETEIHTTSPTEQEFVTKNGSDYRTINFTNSTKEVETETTNSDRQEYTTKNNSDYSTIISANSTKAEIVTFSELQELTSKIQTETEKVTMKYISTNADKIETTYDYKTTREKRNDTYETTAATSLNKQSTIDETEQPLDFECPSRFGLYPDLQNCSRFYQCSQWTAIHMNCPPELHFNPILQVCDWPIDAGCDITLQETSTTDTINQIEVDFDCPSRFGLFPDKSNCSRFYQCSQWTSYPVQCSPGLHFNADLKVCGSPYEAGCDKSLITNEESRSTKAK